MYGAPKYVGQVSGSVKAYERDGPPPFGRSAHQPQGDRLVATDRHETLTTAHRWGRAPFDLSDRLLDIEGIARNVIRVDYLLEAERSTLSAGL